MDQRLWFDFHQGKLTRLELQLTSFLMPASAVHQLGCKGGAQGSPWPSAHASCSPDVCACGIFMLSPDQIILLLECLLEQKTLNPQTLQRLQQTYRLQEQDAEVRHRWCELVIKHKYTKAYEHVAKFLQEDQRKMLETATGAVTCPDKVEPRKKEPEGAFYCLAGFCIQACW
ncbi:hypothetical protein A6R68_11761, partial [Neotoma lepida]